MVYGRLLWFTVKNFPVDHVMKNILLPFKTGLERQIFQVSETIWCVRQPSYFCCSYAVQRPEGVICIDVGMNSAGEDMLALLAAMGRSVQDLRAIFLTHWHNDHAAGAQALHEISGCEVYFHRAEAPWLSRQTARTGWSQRWLRHVPEWGPGILFIGLVGNAIPRAVAATAYLKDKDQYWGLEVLETPGHTPGHLSFYYGQEKALFAGDALAVVDQEIRYMARWVTPDKPRARESMLYCLDREIQLLCPGHRSPLKENVSEKSLGMRETLRTAVSWPLWG